MKKIKNSKELHEAKIRILQRQVDAESAIRKSWMDLKESLSPKNVLNETLMDKAGQMLRGDGVLKNTLMYGLTLFAKKVTDKAEEKAEQMFKKKP